MEEAKRKLYFSLMVVVLAAIVVGVIYYWGSVRDTKIENNGTLVLLERPQIWQ